MSNSKRKAHCGKKTHKTLIAAQIALRRTLQDCKKRGDPIITSLSAYKCPYCTGWHVGRSQKKGIDWEAVAARDAEVHARPASAIRKSEGGRG